MFPSDNNGNNNDPITYIDHSTIFHNNNIITQFSKQEDLPFSLFHLPSPYYYNHCCDQFDLFEELQGNLPQQQQQQLEGADILLPPENHNMPDSDKSQTNGSNANEQHRMMKRTGSKKDRHSKIITARGPRDRRMRLSLAVAKEFFSLQDMLGYDKASKTVEWLLVKAKTEIKKISRSNSSLVVASAAVAKSPSETSEGEVVSGSTDITKVVTMEGKGKDCIKEKKTIRKARKPTFRPLARDLRDQARARAKERTKAKKSMWSQRSDDQSKNGLMNKFGFWSNCFDTGEDSCLLNHGDGNINIGDDSLPNLKKWVPNSIFNGLQNTQEQHLIGFLPFGKPWEEGYNNQNM